LYICYATEALKFKTMSKQLKAKFKVDAVTHYSEFLRQVKMSACYSPDKNSEDNQFSQATPSGDLTMMISNPDAMDFLKPNTKYYLTFVEAED